MNDYRRLALPSGLTHRARTWVLGTGDGTASYGGMVNTGYIRTLAVAQRPFQEPAPWPHQVGVIPPMARSFQHRIAAQRLRTAADVGGTAVVAQLLVGMGGVGKTQLAADYARTAWTDITTAGGLDVLVWITASARSPIVNGYAQAGVELCRADPNDAEKAAHSFLAWLTPKAGEKPCRWLIVLDDVADPEDLKRLWPPASPYGRTLVTTRRRDASLAADGRRFIEIGLFDADEALNYLATSLSGRNESTADLIALARDLGHLPLALDQASAYIIDSGESINSYRMRLADRTTTLAKLTPSTLPDDQVPLAAAWSLSIDRADNLPPIGLARPILQMASMLDGNGIPQTVLISLPALAHFAAQRTGLPHTRWRRWRSSRKQIVAPDEAVQALRVLHRLSLIDHVPATNIYVHQLIQRTTRETLASQMYDRTACVTADALMSAWPDVESDTALVQGLRDNTAALSACAEDSLYRRGAHEVLFRTGMSLGESGQAIPARDHYQHLAEATRRRLGADHPDTLSARRLLALRQGDAGNALGAVLLLAELVTDLVRVLGKNDPYTFSTQGDLAFWRGTAGDAAGAVDVLTDLVTRMERVLGKSHPETLNTRGDLAFWQGKSGDTPGETNALAELLADQIRVLGTEHPDTFETRCRIADLRGEAGDAAGAADAFAGLVDDEVRSLGAHHPEILAARLGLAVWRAQANDAPGTANALADVLTDQIRVFGTDHPELLDTLDSLAYWRGEAGDASGAAQTYAHLLEIRRRVLGEDHSDTLAAWGSLAHWRGAAGDVDGAITVNKQLLSHMVQLLGTEHPDVSHIRHNLAQWQNGGKRRSERPGNKRSVSRKKKRQKRTNWKIRHAKRLASRSSGPAES
ncbi:NB-ARC domain-containing protein [Streptomyces sp. NBC_00414]|uniref:tetratricopeptide repeat protein n=1 Tax=Streptomyces sp. NBC_00414 TaxID=2975739 RepID=UPI002E224F11